MRRLLAGRDLVAELQLAAKMAGGATAAWWLATLAGEPRPVFAALVPLVAMSGDPFSAVNVSLARILGVFAGVGIGVGLLATPLPVLALVAVGLLAGVLAGIPLKVGPRANVQPAVSALFLIGLGESGAFDAGVARMWETAIGAGVAVLVAAFVWPPDPVRELETRLERLRQELAADLAAVAEDLATGSGAASERLDDVRARSLEAVRDVFELDRARTAMRWNPLRRAGAHDLASLDARIRLAGRLYRHARSLARDVADTTVASPALAAATRDLAEAADRALRLDDPDAALARAAAQLASPESAEAVVVAAQLRQLADDVRV